MKAMKTLVPPPPPPECRHGKPKHWTDNQFLDAHAKWLQSVTAKWRRDYPHLADDILEEARLALLDADRDYDLDHDQGASFHTYATKTKIRTRRNKLLRAEDRQSGKSLPPDETLWYGTNDQPSFSLDPNLLALLPSKQAEAIRLRFEEGQNLDNIGKRLGISEAWASKLINKALKNKAFRKALLGPLPKDN